ncbi:septum formation family protein [Streptomyces sp. NPDC002870]|uniref:septum formation family protein n=1 Tax=Streptomyces sp. NPDC002870 TaxID=3364666 RepID=UPI003691F372
MAPPDAQPPEEPPRQEPPYWPWPGEQIPYRRAEHPSVGAHFATEDSPLSPRPRRRWLPAGVALLAVTGIAAAALLLTQAGEPTPDDSAGVTAGVLDEPDDEDYITPTTSEPQETTTEPDEPVDPPDSPSPEESSPSEDEETPPSEEPEEVYVDELSAGDCVDAGENTNYYVIVSCEDVHERQTLDLVTLDDRAEYPGDEVVAEEADSLCWDSYYAASSDWTADEEELLNYDEVTPSSSTWGEGDRTVICFLETLDGSALEGDWLSGSG